MLLKSLSPARAAARLAPAVLVAASGVAASAGASIEFARVALRGDAAPGIPDTTFFSPSIGQGGIAHDGVVAFRASVAGDVVGGGNNQGVWSGLPGALTLIARENEQAAGTVPGVTFLSGGTSGFEPFEQLRVDVGGRLSYLARLQGPGVDTLNDRGIWHYSPGTSNALVARENSQAAGLAAGLLYDRLDVNAGNFGMWGGGSMHFAATIKGPGVTTSNDFVQFIGAPGAFEVLYREGDTAPGTAHTFFNPTGPVVNNNGVAAFKTNLSSNTTSSIFVGTPGALAPIVIEGDAAPGSGGLIFNDGPFNNQTMNSVSINDNRTVAFNALLQDPGGGDVVRSVWRHTQGSGLEMVVRQGDQADGTPAGIGFFATGNIVLNNADEMVVTANLSGPGLTGSNNSGIWAGSPGSLSLVARAGDQMPGHAPGQTFDNLFSTNVQLNDLGQIAFSSNSSVFAFDPSFGLMNIISVGDTIEVAPGEFKTVGGSAISIDPQQSGGPSDGRSLGFNNRGELTMFAIFTDGTQGVIVARIIPVPGSIAVLTCGLLTCARRPRRTSLS